MMHVPITISFFSIFCMFTSFRIQEKDSIVIEKSYRMIYNLFSKLVFLGFLLLIFICRSQKWGADAINCVQGWYFFSNFTDSFFKW